MYPEDVDRRDLYHFDRQMSRNWDVPMLRESVIQLSHRCVNRGVLVKVCSIRRMHERD